MRSQFSEREYAAGAEHMRQAMLAGLTKLPPGLNAGSWTIGAYCALVQLVWENRRPGAGRATVEAMLAAVLQDVLSELSAKQGGPNG